MDCPAFREAVSARLDGEEMPIEADLLDHHLAVCAACARFADLAGRSHGELRLNAARPLPDNTESIVRAMTAGRSGWRLDMVRAVLIGLGVLEVVTGISALAGPVLQAGHISRELGTFALAIGAGLLLAALRPSRVDGLLPVVTVLSAAGVAAGAIDIANGLASPVDEIHHVVELMAVAMLWLLTRRPAPLPVSSRRVRAA